MSGVWEWLLINFRIIFYFKSIDPIDVVNSVFRFVKNVISPTVSNYVILLSPFSPERVY